MSEYSLDQTPTQSLPPPSIDRIRGTMLGLSIGDAMGAPVQFMPRGSFPEVDGFRKGGSFDMSPGEWTDDTAMALCLAESILECEDFKQADQMERYLRWLDHGQNSTRSYAFDIGDTVLSSLSHFRETGQLPEPPGNPERQSGNGGIMRLAPVVIAWRHDPILAIRCAIESSRVTHVSPQCDAACALFTNALLKAFQGNEKSSILDLATPVVSGLLPDMEYQSVDHLMRPVDWSNPPFPILGKGYVVNTLEAALWAFATTNNFAEGLLHAVNLGDDADTVGAVYGQLAGAFYGAENIPLAWRLDVFEASRIQLVADCLMQIKCH